MRGWQCLHAFLGLLLKMDCRKIACWEFHFSRVCLSHHNWKAFAYTPWLPERFYWQLIYVVYKWLITLFHVIYALLTIESAQEFIFVYLTNIGYILFTFYLLWSTVSITSRFIWYLSPCCKKEQPKTSIELPSKPAGCCGWEHNTLKWYDYIQWLLFTISIDISFSVVVLYWALLYRPDYLVTHWDISLHLLNGVFAFFEVWITRTPVRLYHFIYIMMAGVAYVSFTGIYYVAGGRGARNTSYIYPVIDYENEPATAAVVSCMVAFVFLPLIQLFFYANYLLREGILYGLVKKGLCKWLKKTYKQDSPVFKKRRIV